MKHTCVWVLKPAKPGEPAVYCGKKVNWIILRDQDDRPYRQYCSFCPEHVKLAALQPSDE